MPVTLDTAKRLTRRDIALVRRIACPLGPATDALAAALEPDELERCELALALLRLEASARPDAICLVATTAEHLRLILRRPGVPEPDRVVTIPLAELGEPAVRQSALGNRRLSFAEAGFALTFSGRRGRRFAGALQSALAARARAASAAVAA